MRFLAIVAVALASQTAAESQDVGIFAAVDTVSIPSAVATAASADAPSLRSRLVSIDFETLTRAQEDARRRESPPDTLLLNLFDDVVLTGTVERTDATFSGGYSLSGGILGQPLASMTLVVNGNTVAGTVRTLETTYEIRTVDGSRYRIVEVDPTNARFGCEVVTPPEREQR